MKRYKDITCRFAGHAFVMQGNKQTYSKKLFITLKFKVKDSEIDVRICKLTEL